MKDLLKLTVSHSVYRELVSVCVSKVVTRAISCEIVILFTYFHSRRGQSDQKVVPNVTTIQLLRHIPVKLT